MSFFGARVGEHWAKGRDAGQKTKGRRLKTGACKPDSYFAAQTGLRHSGVDNPPSGSKDLALHDTQHATRSTQRATSACPLCRAPLVQEEGLYRCQGRCGACWVEQSPGYLVDLAALPFGVCACCEQPQALVRGDRGAVCPLSGRAYLLLQHGAILFADAAPHGVCQCCVPAMPLIWKEGKLVCQAKPDHQYRRSADQVVLVSSPENTPAATPTETLDAIDAALRRNSAYVTVNGLFDVE